MFYLEKWHEIGPKTFRNQLGLISSNSLRFLQRSLCNIRGWQTCNIGDSFYHGNIRDTKNANGPSYQLILQFKQSDGFTSWEGLGNDDATGLQRYNDSAKQYCIEKLLNTYDERKTHCALRRGGLRKVIAVHGGFLLELHFYWLPNSSMFSRFSKTCL